MHKILSVLLVIILGTAVVYGQQMINAKVAKIIKGDTIETNDPRMRVKIWGVETPEIGQPFGAEARDLLAMLALNKTATIRVVSKETGVVYVDEYDLGLHLVSLGFAWASKAELDKTNLSRFVDAENQARNQKKGLWRDKHPIAPWDWRKGKR